MNKILLILSIFLMIGVAQAVDIEVVGADITWKSSASINQNLTNNVSTVPARIVTDYANILYWNYLTTAPPELVYNASLVRDRIVINNANIMSSSYMYDAPPELDRNASYVTPRIEIRYMNSMWNPQLLLSNIQFIDIKNYKFNKSYLRVPLGTEVTWINFDNTIHNITEDSGKFSSGNLNRNNSYTYKFNIPGVYYYHCKIHPSMKGTVIVITNDKIPPANVSYLKNVSYARNYIKWTWTDPKDIDFEKVLVYINGRYKTSVMKGVRYYNLTGLTNNTLYSIGTRTVDTGGNINKTWMNKSARTAR